MIISTFPFGFGWPLPFRGACLLHALSNDLFCPLVHPPPTIATTLCVALPC